jgi:hypothetical protein
LKAISKRLPSAPVISVHAYKPFACGIVIHPSIDGCIQLATAHRLSAEAIERIELRVHPLVLELTGKTAPRSGLDAKFSVYHACAAGVVFGRAGEAEFADAIVARPDVIALRDRIEAIADDAIGEASADVVITYRDGRRLHAFVAHAIGSLDRPMTDADLERKFHGLADPLLGSPQAARLCAALRSLSACDDLATLVALAMAGAALPSLVPSDPSHERPGPVFVRPSGVLLGLGALAFLGLLAEGAMADWSAVYLHDTLAAAPAVAATGFAAFSLAMAAGRFAGDRLVDGFGAGRVVRVSSTVAAIGLAAALLLGSPAAGIVGFGLVGVVDQFVGNHLVPLFHA